MLYLFGSGRAFIIFDGFDELLDTQYRQEIASDIEAFCTLYPATPVLVTSREVGYDKAPLDGRVFEVYRLADFNKRQVSEYAKKWFIAANPESLDTADALHSASAFINESAIVDDLRANPLMLALMCNIYRGEKYIPRYRPDVYEKCAIMLFERWDKSRGILIPLPFEADISPAMKFLAHWIYSNETLQAGVTEQRLVQKGAEYLFERRFENYNDAKAASLEFIEFCRGRAWVFTDVGTEPDGERLYQFTHRTFLEYFTAAHLVRTLRTPEELSGILMPRIEIGEWDVVAQLAFQLQHKNIEGAGDWLLSNLVSQAEKCVDPIDWTILHFAARCLAFIVPRPRVAREVCIACLNMTLHVICNRMEWKRGIDNLHPEWEPSDLIANLLHSATENRSVIADSLRVFVGERVAGGNEREAVLSLEIGLHLEQSLYNDIAPRSSNSDLIKLWSDLSNNIFAELKNRIMELASRHPQLSLDCLHRNSINIRQFVAFTSIGGLFTRYVYMLFPGRLYSSPSEWLLSKLLFKQTSSSAVTLKNVCSHLAEIGELLQEVAPFEIRIEKQKYLTGFTSRLKWFEHNPMDPADKSNIIEYYGPKVIFGTTLLLACILEFERQRFFDCIKGSNHPFMNHILPIFAARFNGEMLVEAQKLVETIGYDAQKRAFLNRWMMGEISFVIPNKKTISKKRQQSN